jgi:16S rRNA processing protein RimM
MQDIFEVGVITQTHGLKGEVKVFPTTDDPKRF